MEILEDRTLLSSISGTVFNDLNGDGVLQSGEPGLKDWEVDLLQGGQTVQRVLTDASGNFNFSIQNPGTFTIQEQVQPNWLRTSTPATYTVDTTGGDVSGLVFGNFQTVRISGTVFNDLNGDGVQESGELGLPGWTVDLIKGQSVAKRQTDLSGNFTFVGVGPGSYSIQVELQSGYLQTSPPTPYSVTTSSGTDLSGKVFGVMVPQADLAVTKTGPAETIAGDPANLTYTITVVNNGPSDAQSVVLSDLLPAGETFVSQFQLAGSIFTQANSGNSISDTIATLAAQATATFIVVAHVPANIANGTVLHNQASIASITGDPDHSNNASTVDTTVVSQADLTVTKTAPADTIAGDPANLTYTITLTNIGPSDAQNVALSDALPAGETLVSQTQTSGPAFTPGGSGNTISDSIATLAAGASASFTVVAQVSPSVLEGAVLSNTATVGSSTTDPDSTNNSSTASTLVHGQADLTVTKTGPAETIAGDPTNLTYTITLTNKGPSDAQNVALSDALPAGETLVSQTQTSGPAFTPGGSGNAISDSIATLAAGASASFTVVAHVSPSVLEGTVLSNTATVGGSTTDPDSTNNSSTASTLVHALTDTTTIILTSSANPSVLAQPVTFTATVSSAVSGAPIPTGNVDFFDTTTNADLGTITLSDGVAELTTSSLAVGNHAIQASYSGDMIFQPSVGLITQSVQYNFSGYLPPLNKKFAFGIGRTVPIKFQLTDFNGNFITSLSAITSLQVSGPSDVISLTPSLSDDSSQFIAHWKTKGLLAGTYTISLVLADGTTKTLNVQLTTNGKGSATQMAVGTDGGENSGLADTLLAGDLNVYINDPNGYFTADQLARIQDSINGLDALLTPYGIAITEVGDSSSANLVLDIGTTSACGGAADGVLGCFNGPAGEITILQGWNWYAGADPTKINGVQFDFQSTLTHEFGHALGLGGATDPHSPMFETLAMGQAHRTMTVADLNLLEPPQGPDPERAALPPWAGIYLVALGTSGEENLTSNPPQGQSPAAKHSLDAPWADLLSASDFGARTADLLNDESSSFNREAQPTVDQQDEFWSTVASSTVLERITNLTLGILVSGWARCGLCV